MRPRRARPIRPCDAPAPKPTPAELRKDEADAKRRLLEAELRGIERGLISAARVSRP